MKIKRGSTPNYYSEVINLLDNPYSGKGRSRVQRRNTRFKWRINNKKIECDLKSELSQDVWE